MSIIPISNLVLKVKYSSNPDDSIAILSKNHINKTGWVESNYITITNPYNNIKIICKVQYDENMKSNIIYLGKRLIKELKIKLYKKVSIEKYDWDGLQSKLIKNISVDIDENINKNINRTFNCLAFGIVVWFVLAYWLNY